MTETIYLISACDKNSWVWPYWYEYFKRFWDFGCGIDVVFVCEKKHPDYPGIKWWCDNSDSWPGRMKRFVETHPEVKYIVYGVEDQFLMDAVNYPVLARLIKDMKHYYIKYISLHSDKYMSAVVKNNDRKLMRSLIYIPHTHHQVFTFMCAIFDSEFFGSLMHPPEDIWHTEINGHERVRRMGVKTYMYLDRHVIRFREVLRRGEIKPHRMKYLWAVDAGDMFPDGDWELDMHDTGYYYMRWKDKIKPQTLIKDYRKWVA